MIMEIEKEEENDNHEKKGNAMLENERNEMLEIINEISRVDEAIAKEKKTKEKLYVSFQKLSKELKECIEEKNTLKSAVTKRRPWTEGGIWCSSQLRPDLSEGNSDYSCNPISLTEMFTGIVIVLAFSRVGHVIQGRGKIDRDIIAFFAVLWSIWVKEFSYSTRFDTSDLLSQLEMLLTCFAVLFGCLSFENRNYTCIMMVAALTALLHFLLHLKVFIQFSENLVGNVAKQYAVFVMIMTFAEFIIWLVGIFLIPVNSNFIWVVFFFGIVLSLRPPGLMFGNDYRAAYSRSGVLFILLLGLSLQSVVLVVAPFFDEMAPSLQQYVFFGGLCVLLIYMKILYVNDNYAIEHRELLISHVAGFFYNFGEFCLLFSTTILGSGMDLIAHSYLARQTVLPNNAKNILCFGFTAAIASIFFIKSMHVRRVPINPQHKRIFYRAYTLQVIVHFFIFAVAVSLFFFDRIDQFMPNKVLIIILLLSSVTLLVLTCWLDEFLEFRSYGTSIFHTEPFSIWCCLKQTHTFEQQSLPTATDSQRVSVRRSFIFS